MGFEANPGDSSELTMKLLYFIFLFVADCVAGLNVEATNGENVTIPFKTAEMDRATRVRVKFGGEYEEKAPVVVQFCAHGETCPVVETPGVLCNIEQRALTLQRVSYNNSGLYEAQVFIGKVVSQIKAILVVNKPAFSFTNTPQHTSTVNPPDSFESQQLYALLTLLVIISGVVIFLFWRNKHKRARGYYFY